MGILSAITKTDRILCIFSESILLTILHLDIYFIFCYYIVFFIFCYYRDIKMSALARQLYNTSRSSSLSLSDNYVQNNDIGNKHINKYIGKNPSAGYKLDFFNEYRTIDFSCDVLQYLINNGKFTVTPTESTNPIYKLSINDFAIPLLYFTNLNNISFPKLIVNIQIKNLFDSIDFLDNQKSDKSIDGYKGCYMRSRMYYSKILDKLINGKPYDQICDYDRNTNKFIFPQPCISDYGIDLKKYGIENENIYKSDFIGTNIENYFKYIYDFIMRKYNSDYELKFSKGINTRYLNADGSFNKKLVFFEQPIKDKPNTKYIIIGTNVAMNYHCNREFTELPGYNDILKDQIENYEEWIREYTYQEINSPGIDKTKITFADYILNKKKIAGVDFDYMDEMKLLSPTEMDNLKTYLKAKINKMCENKFNKPNCKLVYLWNILEVTFTTEELPSKI